jgi:hypothetical protein
MLIQLTGEEKERYVQALDSFERREGKFSTAIQRVEAFC